MITKLTKEQEAQIDVYVETYFNKACGGGRADKNKLEKALVDAYALVNQEAPTLVLVKSPREALALITKLEVVKNFTDKDIENTLKEIREPNYSGKINYKHNFLWGSQDLYWIAWARYAEYIGVKFTEDELKRLDIVERIAEQCEWHWPYKGLCIASEKPIETRWDGGVLHAEGKPAVVYEDGFSLYSWRGTQVPESWIMRPDEMPIDTALTWENIEQRRCAAEIKGWHNVLNHPSLDVKSIEKDEDPEIGELLEVTLPDVGRGRFLKVQCGTGRIFALPVPPEMKTALEANAWTYDLKPEDYMPEVRT